MKRLLTILALTFSMAAFAAPQAGSDMAAPTAKHAVHHHHKKTMRHAKKHTKRVRKHMKHSKHARKSAKKAMKKAAAAE